MNVHHPATPLDAGRLPGDARAPVSLEALEVIEQALGEALRALRRRAAPPPERDAGEIEYASWLRSLS